MKRKHFHFHPYRVSSKSNWEWKSKWTSINQQSSLIEFIQIELKLLAFAWKLESLGGFPSHQAQETSQKLANLLAPLLVSFPSKLANFFGALTFNNFSYSNKNCNFLLGMVGMEENYIITSGWSYNAPPIGIDKEFIFIPPPLLQLLIFSINILKICSML